LHRLKRWIAGKTITLWDTTMNPRSPSFCALLPDFLAFLKSPSSQYCTLGSVRYPIQECACSSVICQFGSL
jgi:hypothetical protein